MKKLFMKGVIVKVAMSRLSNIPNRTSPNRTSPNRTSIAKRTVLTLIAAATIASVSSLASATVRKDGTWPENEKPVSLDVSGVSRQEAVKELADAAGWSVVMPAAGSGGVGANGGEPVDIHVKNQPASKVLDLILSEGSFVAKRDGTLISITREGSTTREGSSTRDGAKDGTPAAASDAHDSHAHAQGIPVPPVPPVPPMAPIPPIPPVPPVPPASMSTDSDSGGYKHGRRGDDRVVTGGHVTIEKDEAVGDVTVLGGSLDVLGEVEGDLAVFGGNVHVHEGGHVHGDAAVIGGTLNVDDGASIDGDVGLVGGNLKKGDHAHIGGQARDDKGNIKVNVDLSDPDKSDRDDGADGNVKVHASHALREVGSAITMSAFLFIFGSIFLALGSQRMDMLKAEAAARPMKSFALGVVGTIVAIVAFMVLCITLIGIPVALVGVLIGAVALYAGITATLTTAGHAVLGHKTKNPYIHLAAGCAMLLVLGALPHIGTFVWAAVIFVGIGTLVATRCAGLVPVRTRATPVDPYRTMADRG